MAEVNGQNVEQVVAEAIRLALVEDDFVVTQPVREGYSQSVVALREEEDGTTIGVKIIVQDVVPSWPQAVEPF